VDREAGHSMTVVVRNTMEVVRNTAVA